MSLIWYTRCPAPTPFGIAAQQGLLQQEFAADGLEVKALQDADDPLVRQSHFSHSQPWSFRQGGNIPALWARAQGSETRLIGVSWVDEFQALITLDAQLEPSRSSLSGRRFGLPINIETEDRVVDFHRATALRGFSTLLDAVGATLDDVELVRLPHAPRGLAHANASSAAPLAEWLETQRTHEYAREAAALLRGEADVVFVKGATGLDIANVIGARVLVEISAHPDLRAHANNGTPRPLTVDAQLLRERPDIVERVLARTLDVADWAASHPGDAARYVAREVRSAEHWIPRAYGGGVHRQLSLELDTPALNALEDFKRFLFAHGFIASDIDFAQWVDPAPLAAARTRHGAAAQS